MTAFQSLVLGVIQGVTEFIPISSSAHLVLLPWILGWDSPSLAFDTTLHLGTLVAVVVFFREDFLGLAIAWWASLRERTIAGDLQRKIAWLIIGSTPAALMGFLFEDFFRGLFGSAPWVAFLLLVTGLLLVISERWGGRHKLRDIAFGDLLVIGLAQGCGIAPGISRSGATIAAGLLRGLRRAEVARFSFLLATPIIFGAGLLQLTELFQAGAVGAQLPSLIVGFLAAAISGYLCIKLLLAYLQRGRLYVFAAYCWLAGGVSLIVFLMRG